MCEICRKTKAEDILCMLHKEKDVVPEGCKACLGSNANNNEIIDKKKEGFLLKSVKLVLMILLIMFLFMISN
nr:hypothetical protein [Methanobrevibacter arboriphilus]